MIAFALSGFFQSTGGSCSYSHHHQMDLAVSVVPSAGMWNISTTSAGQGSRRGAVQC